MNAKENILSRWFYPALLLAVTLDKPLSSKTLADGLGLKVVEIEAAYRELQAQGMVKLSAHGTWQAEPVKLKITKRNWNVIQRKFLKEQISNSLAVFDQSYETTGKFYSQTLTLSKSGFNKMWETLKATMDHAADQSDLEEPEELIQLNLQFYRLV